MYISVMDGYKRIIAAGACLLCLGCAAGRQTPITFANTAAETAPQIEVYFSGPEEGMAIAIAAFEAGDMQTARLIAQQVADQYPNTAWQRRAVFFQGRTYINLDMASEAEAVMLRSAAEYPELADYSLYFLAEYFFAKGRYNDSALLYQRILNTHPNSFWTTRASFMKAKALLESGAYSEAIESFERFIRDNPRSEFHAEAALDLAGAYAAAGRLKNAVDTYRDVCVKYPGTQYEEQAEKALAVISQKGVDLPQLTFAERYERAQNLFKAGIYDAAYKAFQGMIEDEPGHPERKDILFRIGLSLLHLGRREEAVALLEGMLSEGPAERHGAEALTWLGRAYIRLGRRDDAVNAYLKLVSFYPDSEWADDALYLIGNIYRESNEPKKALAFYERLVKTYPGSRYADSAYWWKAWAYYTSGEYRNTIQALRELITKYPKSFLVSQALYWQGRASERLGRPASAASYYQAVQRLAPYGYYGYRASERLSMLRSSVVQATGEPAQDPLAVGSGQDTQNGDSSMDDGPPVWTEDAMSVLSKNPSFKKVLELMHLSMNKEAAQELWSLQDRMPRRHGALLGLSKAFFELGDYYRSLLIVLKNYDRFLERPARNTSQDFWLLSYPQGYWQTILSAASKYSQDPYLVAAIIHQESRFNPDAISPAGARGVMQVMPSTGEWVAKSISLSGFDKNRLFEPDISIELGTWYLSYLMKRFKGDVMLVAAAYNAGPEAVASWLGKSSNGLGRDEFVESIPFAETRSYVKKVIRNYAEYRRIYGKTLPDGMITPLPVITAEESAE